MESAPMAPPAPEVPVSGAADEVPAAPEPAISQALATTSPPPTAAPSLLGSSTSAAVLERALLEMTQLQADLLSADPRLVAGRLELASGWLHSDLAVRARRARLLRLPRGRSKEPPALRPIVRRR